jgi:hypothetical protein
VVAVLVILTCTHLSGLLCVSEWSLCIPFHGQKINP